MGLCAGKESKQGPTPEMLRTFYKLLFIMTGDLNSGTFGPLVNKSQDDVGILQDFMAFGANYLTPRGVWVMGDGFAQCQTQSGGVYPAHTTLLQTYLATVLRDGSYQAVSGNTNDVADLLPTSIIAAGDDIYGVQNSCVWSNDLLSVNTAVPGATAASYYQNYGPNGPYVASVYAPSSVSHPYVTLVDGWEIDHLRSRFDETSMGRHVYFINVMTNVFGSICPFTAAPTVDVPNNTARTVNFLGNVWGNPMVTGGKATVRFCVAKSDRGEVKVYDVTGRLMKSLADRSFPAGEHSLTWDGSNDQGQVVARGVYFTQVKFVNSRFVDAKKVTVLK
jgi:hypothetical protein